MRSPLTDRALPERLTPWGVTVLESHHSPRFTMEWRRHHFVKIVYVLSGHGTFYIGDHEQDFTCGDVVLITPQTPNRIVDDPASAPSLYICCLARRLLRFDPDLLPALSSGIVPRHGNFANRVASRLRRMVHAQQTERPLRAIAMVADALKLVEEIAQRPAKRSRESGEIAEVRALVQQYIDTLPMRFFEESSIDHAANQLGISRRTFTQVFSELTGQTWLAYLRRLAIEHACQRLTHTDLPITSVAFESGFNDLSTFYRQFKQHTGKSPGEYRSITNSIDRISSTDQ